MLTKFGPDRLADVLQRQMTAILIKGIYDEQQVLPKIKGICPWHEAKMLQKPKLTWENEYNKYKIVAQPIGLNSKT